ncbi:uncharacterized protein LOC119401863 isoform X2 [Rhipicephalus sanguineus]|uniref:uncharacterized protein LOC119401863 isoform X2 n=1 Tax=Rhipicephalus sanguineus TaxID=34632 RepID=UPI0018942CAE|nr:uncharacterized protein LOC119401863 isoform X2 [Rhipicephalus sanguineus]
MPERQRSVTGWRATHVVAYLLAMGTSIAALVCYRKMNARLHTTVDKCLLFTKPWIDVDSSTGKCQIDYTRIEWSSDKLCNYVTFALLASFVYSIVAVWFFVMCAPSRGSQLHDSIVHVWKIVAPASLLSGVMALITLVMAWKVTNGMNIFFHDLNMGVQRNCSTSSMIGWKDNTVALLLADRVPTKIFVWLVFFCWMFATMALVIRCATAADFSENKRDVTVAASSGTLEQDSTEKKLLQSSRSSSMNLFAMKPRAAPLAKPPLTDQAHSTPSQDQPYEGLYQTSSL